MRCGPLQETRVRLILCFLLGLPLAACGSASPDPDDPSRASAERAQSLALSHLKAADVELERQTTAAAEESIRLANEGLRWAPPAGKAQAWTISRLLLARGRAQRELGALEAAEVDLQAALQWAARDHGKTPDLIGELNLEMATILIRQGKLREAAPRLARTRQDASRLGAPGASLQCEALILDGDLSLRLARRDQLDPERLYRSVFDVARRYDYPEGCWDAMDRALGRLGLENSSEATEIMAPVTERRAAKLAALESKKSSRARTSPANSMYREASTSGYVPNAATVIGALRPEFRRCYQRGLEADSNAQGQVHLSIAVGPDGSVTHIEAEARGVSEDVKSCLIVAAKKAQFDAPESGEAVISVPVSFVKQ